MAKKKTATKAAPKGKKSEKKAKPAKKDLPKPGTSVQVMVRGVKYGGTFKGIKKPTGGGGKGNYERALVAVGDREIAVAIGSMSW